MSADDNENYYVLEEDLEDNGAETDQSPMNFAAYNHDEDEEDIEEEETQVIKQKKSSLGLLFKIMFNPVEGWKSLRRSHMSIETLQSSCFYPLLAILALSEFADFFYSVTVGLSQVITQSVVTFVAFFFGFFGVQMILTWVLPKDVAIKFESKFGKEYILIGLSTLALFTIFTNLLPMLWPILIFLPIWTLYIMFKGVRFFHIDPRQEMKFFVLSGSSVIGVPLLIDWVLNTLLPY